MPRCNNHDYKSRCIYHITLKKNDNIPVFASLCGTFPKIGTKQSMIGKIIERHIWLFPKVNGALKVLQYCIMPDHVHLLIFVTEPIELHLGNYIGKFKVSVYQDYKKETGTGHSIFKDDFYDCILYSSRSLDNIFRYIKDNPRRLAIRRLYPEYFRRVNRLMIVDKRYEAYGNFQLLNNPFKSQVIIHRADSQEVSRMSQDMWLYAAANGGVLVSPFISHAEKDIFNKCVQAGGRFILIVNNPLGDRFKPSGKDFELCESGRLLIISAGIEGNLSRQVCLTMNKLAENITNITFEGE